ncbi:CAP10 domain-containing protein [Favolaschia claudopus]|uniref:CAP10 domain-containing protein n=1 Tax=Favolaschia claudopus TaxID=2862362 RepID=A0AAW0DT81_9AGAR
MSSHRSLTPDVEHGSHSLGRRRSSPSPTPNNDKLIPRLDAVDHHLNRHGGGDNDKKTRVASTVDSMAAMRANRRPSPRALYGWLHHQSGYIFLLVVFLVFLRAGLHAAAPPPSLLSSSSSSSSSSSRLKSWLSPASTSDTHPIPSLMSAASARFRAKLARQSPSLAAAAAEYTRRYARPPPAGFDLWYAFAVKHNFVMIDEFDSVVSDLQPFWNLTGAEVRERAALVGSLPSVDLVRVRGGKAETVRGGEGLNWVDSEVSARANGFKAMLGKFVAQLPDMDFPINAKAEGRVVVPWEHQAYPNITSPSFDPATFRPDWAGQGSVWDAWRRTCAPSAPARRLYSSVSANAMGAGASRDRLAEAWFWMQGRLRKQGGAGGEKAQSHPGVGSGAEFSFVQETGAGEVDFCASPGAHYTQGHFFSDWRTLPVLVPIFSPARAAGFGDIRVPSHYYYGGTRRYTYAWDPINLEQRAVDAMEVPWEKKKDVVWWRGASTGGGSSPSGFGRGYQRHRFLRISSIGLVPGTMADAQRMTPVTFAVPPRVEEVVSGPGDTVPVPLSLLNADVMDAAFVKSVVPVGKEHRFGDSTELGVAWGYKYLLDLDGMGYSGRFMAFLASDSVPVKATVYDEFFSGWIEPWVHYIPLSATYSEIYNIVSYFSGPSPAALRAAGLPAAPRGAASASGYRGAGVKLAAGMLPDEEDDEFDEDDELLGESGAGLGDGDGEDLEAAIGSSDPRLGPPQQQMFVRSAEQEEGDRRLRRIARAGKQWKQTMGRTIDMEVYVYRLAIEYARLWADDREAMSYKP